MNSRLELLVAFPNTYCNLQMNNPREWKKNGGNLHESQEMHPSLMGFLFGDEVTPPDTATISESRHKFDGRGCEVTTGVEPVMHSWERLKN